MPSASDRSVFRRDNALFALCVVLSLVMLARPDWGGRVTGLIRGSVLRPFLSIQEWAESSRTARASLDELRSERDSAVHAAQFLHSLRAENERLRALLGLGQRLSTGFIPADVLHQALPTDGRTLLLSAGARDGVRQFDVVVAPAGLVGVVQTVGAGQSIAMTWAHPEFRASAFAQPGDVFGIVAPAVELAGTEHLLQLRGVAIRDSLPAGTLVLTSGLGGVFPPGIPVGTVIGPVTEETGW
ncbi:MAG: rod shape-determining protein MreC, partial [Gemmatimonadota bacterium]|nr:rod shape-determining protein MreC [Gemmatimonadota bacterium]